MLGQLQIAPDGQLHDKVEMAIRRLKSFEPEEGYYLAFSGGKDSQCIYHLCVLGGVKFDAHYALTTVDPPELVYFIREHYPDAWEGRVQQTDKDGKPITMWSLIAEHTIPPTRKARYCCAALKEPGGKGRIVVTGVRWAESPNRAATHDVVYFQGKRKTTQKKMNEAGVNFRINKHGDVVMNDDNDDARRVVESCYRTQKTMVNPIIDWTDEDVWDFLNNVAKVPHCRLYDEGFTRLGCICCPLSGSKNMIRDLERWPQYKKLYTRALQKMLDNHPDEIKVYRRVDYQKTVDPELLAITGKTGGVHPRSVDTVPGQRKAGRLETDEQDRRTESNSCRDGRKWDVCDRRYEPVPLESVTAEQMIDRWLWLANPVDPPPEIIPFNPQNKEAAEAAITDLYKKYRVVLTDGWTGG